MCWGIPSWNEATVKGSQARGKNLSIEAITLVSECLPFAQIPPTNCSVLLDARSEERFKALSGVTGSGQEQVSVE
jgi:hypothetical protein